MMKRTAVIALVLALISTGICCYLLFGKSSDLPSGKPTVVMDSYMVFEGFDMKKDYDKRMEKEMSLDQGELDKLGKALNGERDPLKIEALKKTFTQKKLAFDEKFGQLSEQYTNEVYKRLNDYIKAYGKEKGYGVIIGSNGQGSVMYVDEKQDITKDLIRYINEQYNK
jgi:outer membrane protein